jgi:hypothetical protein
LGTSGHRGPDSTKRYANAPWNEGDFSIVDGQQQWTVPASGTYRIEAAGAYGATSGRVVSGEVNLSEGQVVSLLVGQQPTPANVADNVTVGGGGGTFVTSGGKPLIVASGGDGGSTSGDSFEQSEFSTDSDLSSISGDGNTIVSIIENTLYIYNKINNLWILNNQTINGLMVPVYGGKLKLNHDGTKILVIYGSDQYPNYSSTNVIYTYSSLTGWDNGTTLLVNSRYPTYYADLSGDGNVIGITYPDDTYIFRYSNGYWTYDIIPSLGYVLSLSNDGNTLVSATIGGQQVTVFKYTNGSWDSGINVGIEYPNNTIFAAISGDEKSVIAQYGYSNLCILYKYINGSWDSGTQLSIGSLGLNGAPVAINYDGSIAFYKWSDTKVAIYNSGLINNTGTELRNISCTSDGNQVLFSYGPQANGNTSLFSTKISRTGSFSPFGNGLGFSGAGYLTDGEATDPFFQFLKPNAYINGGFGNLYPYDIGIEGGFGGGQTPIGLLTTLTSVTGYANVYPGINVQSISSIALDSSGTTVIIGQTNYDKATVYKYSNGAWDEGYDFYTWYTAGKSVALSADGNTAVVSSLQGFAIFIYSGGGWYQQYYVEGGFDNYFGYSVALNSSGTILFVGAPYTYGGPAYVSVYRFSGSVWYWSENLPINIPGYPNLDGFGYSLSSSVDGNKVIVGMSSFYSSSFNNAYIFTYSNDSWDSGISLSGDGGFGTSVALSDDGTTALVGAPVGKYATLFKYIDGVWTTVQTFSDTEFNFGISVALADNGTTQIIGSTSLIKIYKSGQTYISYSDSSIIAVQNNILAFSLKNNLVAFENLNAPTTTCTAVTSIPHGYPHNYKVQITGTDSFNGTWDIVTATANTFTFQAFGGPSETAGYVSGTTTGVSGGGGYTGSPGNGVSGATCYADASVTNFTDLGATSNSAGYVTISLINPVPITLVYDDTIIGSEIYVSPSGFAYWSDIAYSPELKIFVAPSSFYNGQGIAYSTDGKQWFRSDYEGAGPLALSWSPELGIFITGTNYRIYTSFNGKNWTLASFVDFYGFIDVIWVQFLHEFICITTIDNYYKSSDGINWYPITVSPPVYYGDYGHSIFAASPDTVIACLSTYVYASTDGVNWDTALTTSNNILATAYGNGIFFVITYLVEPNTFTYYYSADNGQTWSNGTLTFNYLYNFHVSVVFTDSSVIVTGANETFVSNDCITWTLYPNNTIVQTMGSGGYNSAVYNPLDKYIVAVSDREINLTLDGSIWVPADTTFIGGAYDNVAYSPETNTVVAVASNGQISTETGIYTKDGVNWKRIPGLYFNPVMCKWNPLQNLFFLGFNNLCFDPFSERIVQSSYSEWIEPTTPPQLLQSYYQQGLNNNLPIGKAFSLSGIIVDTGANGYGGDRVSCSGDVFIKMQRYPNGTAYRSTDGTNWESYQLQGDSMGQCQRIVYVLKYKAFFSLSGQEGRVYKSYDSVNWSTVYQSPGIYLYDMLWCSTMNKLLLFSSANNLTELTFSN